VRPGKNYQHTFNMKIKHSACLSKCVTCCTVVESFLFFGNTSKGKTCVVGFTLKDLSFVCPGNIDGCVTYCLALQHDFVVLVHIDVRRNLVIDKHRQAQGSYKANINIFIHEEFNDATLRLKTVVTPFIEIIRYAVGKRYEIIIQVVVYLRRKPGALPGSIVLLQKKYLRALDFGLRVFRAQKLSKILVQNRIRLALHCFTYVSHRSVVLAPRLVNKDGRSNLLG